MLGILEDPYHATKNAAVALPSNMRIWPSCLRIFNNGVMLLFETRKQHCIFYNWHAQTVQANA